MGCLKGLCYTSAAIHILLTIIGSAVTILICVWYDDQQKLIDSTGVRETPYWMFVVLAIYFVFGFLSTISLIRGILTERPRLFTAFFSNMIAIIVFIVIIAIVVMVRQLKANYSTNAVVSEFFMDISYCVFSAIVMIPCFILYKKLSGYSYFENLKTCYGCCGKKHEPSRVPNYQV